LKTATVIVAVFFYKNIYNSKAETAETIIGLKKADALYLKKK